MLKYEHVTVCKCDNVVGIGEVPKDVAEHLFDTRPNAIESAFMRGDTMVFKTSSRNLCDTCRRFQKEAEEDRIHDELEGYA